MVIYGIGVSANTLETRPIMAFGLWGYLLMHNVLKDPQWLEKRVMRGVFSSFRYNKI